jgi:hypothetical protein
MPAFPYESCFQRVDQEFVMTHFAHGAAKGPKNSRYFSTAREMVRTPAGPGSFPSTRSNVQTDNGPQKFFGKRRPLPHTTRRKATAGCHGGVGRGCGVGRGLGVGPHLPVHGVGVGVGLGVGVGPPCAQYLPPLTKAGSPPQTIISLPVQTAV